MWYFWTKRKTGKVDVRAQKSGHNLSSFHYYPTRLNTHSHTVTLLLDYILRLFPRYLINVVSLPESPVQISSLQLNKIFSRVFHFTLQNYHYHQYGLIILYYLFGFNIDIIWSMWACDSGSRLMPLGDYWVLPPTPIKVMKADRMCWFSTRWSSETKCRLLTRQTYHSEVGSDHR